MGRSIPRKDLVPDGWVRGLVPLEGPLGMMGLVQATFVPPNSPYAIPKKPRIKKTKKV